MNDWELLGEYIQSRSQRAFAELVARHGGWIRASARRQVRDPHLADDVTQAVFVALDRQARKLKAERGALSTWLFQVTRYASRAALLAQRRRRHHEREAAAMGSSENDAMTPAQWEQLAPVLDELIHQLRTDDQRAVLLRFFQQKSYPEMAEVLGISEEAARKRTDRAIDKLRQMTRSHGIAMTVGALAAGLLARSSDAAAVPRLEPPSVMSPSPRTTAIAKGALTMMTISRLRVPAMVATSCLLLAMGAAAWLHAAEPAKEPAAPPTVAASAPASAPASTQPMESTPKGIVIGAFHAAATGDAAGMIARFDKPTRQQQTLLRQLTSLMTAADELRKAVSDKFGADMEQEFSKAIGSGVMLSDVTNATETVTGDTAVVDIVAGPGQVPCVKVNGQWKISPDVLRGVNPKSVAQFARGVPAIKAFAADVRAGKYKTVEELQQGMQATMTGRPQ